MISSSGTSSKPRSVSMPFIYLIGFPLGSWIMRKAMVPSVEVAGKSLTGTRTRERRRLPDQTGMGAMRDTRERYGLSRIWDSRCPPQVNKGGPQLKNPGGGGRKPGFPSATSADTDDLESRVLDRRQRFHPR